MAAPSKRTLVTGPTVEPVSLEELKQHCRLDSTDEDELLAGLIKTSRQLLEEELWRALINQTWNVYFDAFSSRLWLPLPPLGSVSSVKYTDTDGTVQTVATTVWETGNEDGISYVRLAYDQTWPTDSRGHPDDVVLQIVAGYGADAADVPMPIRQVVKMFAGDLYEHREAHTVLRLWDVPTYQAMLAPYRVRRGLDEIPC